MYRIHHKIIGLFCKRDLQKRLYSAKETYNFFDPTTHSQMYRIHRIPCIISMYDFEFDCRAKTFWSGERVIWQEWIIIIWTSDRAISYESYTMSHRIRNYRSLLQNIVCFTGLFCKRDLYIASMSYDAFVGYDSITCSYEHDSFMWYDSLSWSKDLYSEVEFEIIPFGMTLS